ncbi:MAG: bacterioferritin [Acidimicrobiales bacterium]
MDGSSAIIEFLNEALTAELTAINQYFAHSKLCESWGWTRLAEKFRHEALDEMRDAEKIIERILVLEGMPNLQRLGSVQVGETVPEQLGLDRSLEEAAVAL